MSILPIQSTTTSWRQDQYRPLSSQTDTAENNNARNELIAINKAQEISLRISSTKRTKLEETIVQLKQSVTNLEKEISGLATRNEKLIRFITIQTNKEKESTAKIDTLTATITQLSEQLKKAQEDNRLLQETNQKTQEDNRLLQKTNRDLKAELNHSMSQSTHRPYLRSNSSHVSPPTFLPQPVTHYVIAPPRVHQYTYNDHNAHRSKMMPPYNC